jgi:ATP-dependent Clp protease, protease subunit
MNTVVLEETEQGDMPVDVYQRLSNDRILFITGLINDKVATDIAATLLLKDNEDEGKITIFINSPGGSLRNVFMIYDMMRMIDSPVETICIGSAFDAAAVLLSAGEPGMRLATKNSFISVGQLEHNWTSQFNMTDVEKVMQITEKDNKSMMEIFAQTTNKPLSQIYEDFDRRVFMNSVKAKKYGFVDRIITFSKKGN